MAGCPAGARSLCFDCDVPASVHADSGQRSFGVAGIEQGDRPGDNGGGNRVCRNTGYDAGHYCAGADIDSDRIDDLVARDTAGAAVETDEVADLVASDNGPGGIAGHRRLVCCSRRFQR